MPGRIVVIASVLGLLACEDKPPGRKLASGIAQRLTVSRGAVAFLLDAAHPDDRTLPEDLLAGDLWLGAIEGKEPAQKVGSGVSSSPGAFAFAKGGEQLAFLGAWRFRAGLGELWTAAPGAEPVQVAKEASALAWSPAEPALAFVAPNHLGLRKAGGREANFVPIEGLQAVVWAPDGKHVAARAGAPAGGKLFLVELATGARREVAPGTSDFAFAPDGALAALGPPPPKGGDRPLLLAGAESAPKEIARATAFAFSPDGKEVALLSTDKQPGEATGDLSRLSRAGGAPQPVGQKVSDWRWAPSGDLLFLARYDLRARAGTLTVAPVAGGAPREIASKVQSFAVQGRRVLYLVQAPQKGDFKIELWEADLAAATPPRKVDEGVYGWQLSPDGSTLYYKARCAGGPRSCSLLREPVGTVHPVFLAANVAGFDLSEDGSRVLLHQPHRGASRAVDLAVIPAAGPPPEHVKAFVEEVDTSSRFADAAGKRVVFATITAGKGGVYVAEAP
jgi:dipeptidyl aminopeptidase/acylaminoacyl peptidase